MSRLVIGIQCVREALKAHGSKVTRVLIEHSDSPTLAGLERLASAVRAPVERVPRAALDRLSKGSIHQGVAAEAPALRLRSLADVAEAPLILALDSIQDPQNFGAVVRAAVAVADAPVLWPEHASAPLSMAMFRASAGAVEQARLVRVSSLRGALGEMAARGAQVIGLEGHATRCLHEFDLTRPTVLVLGSEGQGLHKSTRAVATLAKLPMSGKLDSLNASTAAAVALYEWARQNAKPSRPGEGAGSGPRQDALEGGGEGVEVSLGRGFPEGDAEG